MSNVRIVDPQEMAAARAASLADSATLARCAEEIAQAELIDADHADAGCTVPPY